LQLYQPQYQDDSQGQHNVSRYHPKWLPFHLHLACYTNSLSTEDEMVIISPKKYYKKKITYPYSIAELKEIDSFAVIFIEIIDKDSDLFCV
jgi:hypothetical protein